MNRRVVNLEELDVEIAGVETVDHLIGLFVNYRNIKKFTLRAWRTDYDDDLSRIVRTILPLFSELEELTIDTRNYENEDLNGAFDVISSCCPNLRKLGVGHRYVEHAENYFRKSNLIIFNVHVWLNAITDGK
jgi:hypothetical protein